MPILNTTDHDLLTVVRNTLFGSTDRSNISGESTDVRSTPVRSSDVRNSPIGCTDGRSTRVGHFTTCEPVKV